jgi:hypothetical protein
MRTLINFAAFQIGWFSCVLSAANGLPWIGFLVVGLVVGLHFKVSDRRQHELQLLVLAVFMGLIFDSLLVASGWVRYPSGMLVSGIAPYWILAMWALFATTLNVSMGWLKSSLVLASVMGAVFGPLSYVAGQRLGAIELVDFRASMIALAVIWAIAMPALMYAAGRYDRVRNLAPLVPLQKLSGRE